MPTFCKRKGRPIYIFIVLLAEGDNKYLCSLVLANFFMKGICFTRCKSFCLYLSVALSITALSFWPLSTSGKQRSTITDVIKCTQFHAAQDHHGNTRNRPSTAYETSWTATNCASIRRCRSITAGSKYPLDLRLIGATFVCFFGVFNQKSRLRCYLSGHLDKMEQIKGIVALRNCTFVGDVLTLSSWAFVVVQWAASNSSMHVKGFVITRPSRIRWMMSLTWWFV